MSKATGEGSGARETGARVDAPCGDGGDPDHITGQEEEIMT
jgi:hypothetical protein